MVATFIVEYGPNEDEMLIKKEEFWEELSMVIETVHERIMILGDLMGRKTHNSIEILYIRVKGELRYIVIII